MYIPAHFAADDATVHDLLARHGAADLRPEKIDGTLAFMFESRWMIIPTRQAMEAGHRQQDYDAVWGGLTRSFST